LHNANNKRTCYRPLLSYEMTITPNTTSFLLVSAEFFYEVLKKCSLDWHRLFDGKSDLLLYVYIYLITD
jgi:hypothetical protein